MLRIFTLIVFSVSLTFFTLIAKSNEIKIKFQGYGDLYNAVPYHAQDCDNTYRFDSPDEALAYCVPLNEAANTERLNNNNGHTAFKTYTSGWYIAETNYHGTMPDRVSSVIYKRDYEYYQYWKYSTTVASGELKITSHNRLPSIYDCPTSYPYHIDTNGSGEKDYGDRCSNIEPTCDCTEDLVDNQCVARTPAPDYSGNSPSNFDDGLLFSDANNQGLKCGLVIPPQEQDCPSDASNIPDPNVNNPINCTNGVKRQTETDYSSSVGGIRLSRTYSSTEVEQDTFERYHLESNQELPDNVQLISYREDPNVSYHEWEVEGLPFLNIDTRFNGFTAGRLEMPNGRTLTYTKGASESSWARYSDKDGTLEDASLGNGETGYKFTSPNGTIYQFDSEGRLTSKTYRNGQTHTITYPSATHAVITDSFGRSADIYYDEVIIDTQTTKRVITKFIDPAGNEYRYQHDNKGYITKVTYPDNTPSDWTDNPFKEYVYDDRTQTKVLTGIIDENGDQYASYGYDAKNRATSTQHAGGAIKATINYLDGANLGDPEAGESSVKFYRNATNYREAVYHHKIYNGINKVTKLEQKPCPDCVVGDYTYEYDENGFLSQATTPEGDITQYTYNLRGLLESKTEAFGTAEERTVTTTWHGSYKLPLTIDEPQRLTTYSYDANGNLLSRSVKDKVTNDTRTVSYTYNGFGQVLTVDGSRTDVSDITTYDYDTSGNLTKITNALGHETLITSHDAHGKPLSITDPNGTVTTLTYLPRGWLTSVTTDGDSTTYGYDKAGQLTSVTMANGVVLNYEYDAAHRLVAIEDAAGNRIEYTLDNYGNRTRTDIKDSTGTIKSYAQQVYNDLGQLKQTLGANNQANDFDYDAEGKPTQSEDALDNPTTQHFDALDRLQKVVDPALGETEFDYDSQDRLTSVTDATDKTTSYQYNAFGDVLSITSPDTGTTSMTYDSAGNVLTTTDARNITTTYSYDALNRVTSIDYPGTTEDMVFSYDSVSSGNKGVGRLTQITDESGSTAYEYDAKGQLVAETRTINGTNFTTGYAYDDAGLIAQVTYLSGRTVDYQRNNLGQITNMTTTTAGQTQTIANNISYLPFGPLTDLTYGNGKVLTQSFDQDYRLTSKHTTGLYQLGYGYTPRNNIDTITDALDSSKNQSFSYDVLSRLTDASGQYGIQDYSFDAIGNRLTKTQDGVTESYTYSSTSHRLDSVGSTNLTYDAVGNTLTKGALTFTYNQVGRLATASKTSMNASYVYNAQGQRVKKTIAISRSEGTTSATTLYHYDQGGQLIAETDGQGSVLKEYLYLDGMRIATVDNGALYYVHTDHLGAPLALTDSNGTVQWKGSYDPYGNVTVEVNNLDQSQRFPGQRYSAESGLHYNYFRDYDPEIGRYLQSDPIGLNGGINTYGYVGGNPVNAIDPLGLDTVLIFKTERDYSRNVIDPWGHSAEYAKSLEENKCQSCNDDIYIYDVNQVDQVNQALSSYNDIKAVYIIGHSSDQGVYVGSTPRNRTNISLIKKDTDVHPADLNWSGLTNDAEIYIWGCNAGKNDNPIAEAIANASGATTHAFDGFINFESNGRPFVRWYKEGGPVTFKPAPTPKPIPPVSSELSGY